VGVEGVKSQQLIKQERRGLRQEAGVPVTAGAKERLSDTEVRIVSGGSILELLRHLRDHKARSVRVACTHGIFAGSATRRLAAAGHA
jgi:hypothetical protein